MQSDYNGIMEQVKRYRGCLMGLATADAVGTTLEFKPPGTFTPITDMVGGGPFHLKAGQWTDDTSMALCLAASLVEKQGFDATDQMERYVRWWQQGYMSSTGVCFDIGNTVTAALREFQHSGNPFSGSTHPHAAGNGSIMRLAPVPLFYSRNPAAAIIRSGESSRTTHGTKTAVDGCRYLGAYSYHRFFCHQYRGIWLSSGTCGRYRHRYYSPISGEREFNPTGHHGLFRPAGISSIHKYVA